MKQSEVRHIETKRRLDDIVERLDREAIALKKFIDQNNVQFKDIGEDLAGTKLNLAKTQKSTEDAFDKIHSILDAPGLNKPKLDTMVMECGLYERVAKEKNYVVAINSVYNGNEEVDLSASIAAFSYDYAAWIAYQADHESLMRAIAGTDPAELVYSDEDTESRRKHLLDW